MLAFFRFIKFYNEGEITMVSVRKRGKVYEYRFEIATVEGTRKWITKSGYPTKAEAFKEGAKAYNDFYYNGQKTQLRENMSYADFLDYWIDNYASFNLHYSTTISYINIIKNHVKPRVGFYKLWQLDTRLLQEFINKIYVEYGFSKNYMASILKVVKGSLKYACYTLPLPEAQLVFVKDNGQFLGTDSPKYAFKVKRKVKSTVKNTKTAIKTSKEVAKKTEKTAKETIKASKRTMQIAKETAKRTAQGVKVAIKTTISAIKAIIAGTKALVAAIVAGGWVAVIVIIVICLVALMCSSIFGIFFSSQKTSANSITMNTVVAECNQEFSDKLQSIQDSNPHDDYVLEGSMASWKDVLIVYTIKQSNGVNQQDVMTIDDNKKNVIKQIFWDMNSLTSEVKDEMVTEQGTNADEMPKQVQKKVLHIKINTKTLEQMKNDYHFSPAQNKQLAELTDNKYASLWNGVIYGATDSGEYVNWRQAGQSWSNIKIGNTNSTIGNIGCLVTSIAILIEKSGVPTPNIEPFNPGTFVEALNKNGGFDG